MTASKLATDLKKKRSKYKGVSLFSINTHKQISIWGISKIASNPPEALPLIEITPDDAPALKKKKAFTLNFSFWHINAQEDIEHYERESILLENCESLRPLAVVISIPPSVVRNSRTQYRVHSLIERINLVGLCPIYFDFGRLVPPLWIDPRYCVSDPLWNAGIIWGDYWKIHGWHPERWIRIYPLTQLRRLYHLASDLAPKFVILAHSQRAEQWQQLRDEGLF